MVSDIKKFILLTVVEGIGKKFRELHHLNRSEHILFKLQALGVDDTYKPNTRGF